MDFLDLPLELLSDILSPLAKPQHLASACLVNKAFNQFGTPRLYERVSIYSWHKHSKAKVLGLFNTLAHCPYLAKYVLKLEIRDFPKSVGTVDLEELVVQGLKNCTSLQSCTWTRDGSLSSEVLAVLQTLDTLVELEINGHSDGQYDATLLSHFSHLRRISLIMPSAEVVRRLSPWMATTGATLSSLTLICKMSSLITDRVLESLAPSLCSLEQFSITGCPRVTYLGIWSILSHNTAGLHVLGLEGLPRNFNIGALSSRCTSSDVLVRLRSFTLSIYSDTWLAAALEMLAQAPLQQIQLYATHGALAPSAAADTFWTDLVTAHGARLTRVSVHRMPISLRTIADVCARCTSLRQLFVVVDPDPVALTALADCLATAPRLCEVHVNSPQRSVTHDSTVGVMSAPEALALVRRCPESIMLFGCNARVWHVERRILRNDEGELIAERVLTRYDSPDIPEQFLVVRT
ncbi:hypothetical protein GGX14DRAFT_474011 [Mycena pura]|uniref:F-box domain-containing protein n=1 Tax=Mycena pura TaxID=153505 RepID=A0AAD6UWD4_9AGAR|nr:hypothetical protein GGX14DRAFT_474011 [Mycena pura]